MVITLSIGLNTTDLLVFFMPVFSQSNNMSFDIGNINQTESASKVVTNATTKFENSTITLTATRIGTEGINYIWTSEGRNNPILNLRSDTRYQP